MIAIARRRGAGAAKLPGGRALIALDLAETYARYEDKEQDAAEDYDTQLARATRRAGIEGERQIVLRSADTVSRSPTMAPWSIVLPDPEDCAAVVCDLVTVELRLSLDRLATSFSFRGLHAELVLPKDGSSTLPVGPFLRVSSPRRILTGARRRSRDLHA